MCVFDDVVLSVTAHVSIQPLSEFPPAGRGQEDKFLRASGQKDRKRQLH